MLNIIDEFLLDILGYDIAMAGRGAFVVLSP
jgi:hypothetical protein